MLTPQPAQVMRGALDAHPTEVDGGMNRILNAGLLAASLACAFVLILLGATGCDRAPEQAAQVSPSSTPQSRRVDAGERVAMANGLSVILPGDQAGKLYYGRGDPAMYAELLLAEPDPGATAGKGVAIVSLADEKMELPDLARFEQNAEVVASSRHVKVLWGAWEDQTWLMIVTRLPDDLTGVVWDQLSSATTAAGARQEARRLWDSLSVQGATLPI